MYVIRNDLQRRDGPKDYELYNGVLSIVFRALLRGPPREVLDVPTPALDCLKADLHLDVGSG
jgi:hypothetical protein